MAGCTLPWSRRPDVVYQRVVAVINSATHVPVELRRLYLDDLECAFEIDGYANLTDEGIIEDLALFGQMAGEEWLDTFPPERFPDA